MSMPRTPVGHDVERTIEFEFVDICGEVVIGAENAQFPGKAEAVIFSLPPRLDPRRGGGFPACEKNDLAVSRVRV